MRLDPQARFEEFATSSDDQITRRKLAFDERLRPGEAE
jgi:hypothetical protein